MRKQLYKLTLLSIALTSFIHADPLLDGIDQQMKRKGACHTNHDNKKKCKKVEVADLSAFTQVTFPDGNILFTKVNIIDTESKASFDATQVSTTGELTILRSGIYDVSFFAIINGPGNIELLVNNELVQNTNAFPSGFAIIVNGLKLNAGDTLSLNNPGTSNIAVTGAGLTVSVANGEGNETLGTSVGNVSINAATNAYGCFLSDNLSPNNTFTFRAGITMGGPITFLTPEPPYASSPNLPLINNNQVIEVKVTGLYLISYSLTGEYIKGGPVIVLNAGLKFSTLDLLTALENATFITTPSEIPPFVNITGQAILHISQGEQISLEVQFVSGDSVNSISILNATVDLLQLE